MLFVYPLIILCLNFINISCDVHKTNIYRGSRREIASGGNRYSNVSSPQDSISISTLETSIPITKNLDTKRNITRVRKYKRRKLTENVSNPVETVAEKATAKSEEREENIKSSENFYVKTNFHLESDVKGVEKANKEKNIIETVSENAPIKAKDKIVEENVVIKKTEHINVSTSAPQIFPKRPPEFNPVFKKRRERDPVVRIVNEKNFVYGHNGNFHYSFEGGDGTKVYSKGKLIAHEETKAGEGVVGGYSYKDTNGNDYSLSYTADQNGYRPVGAHLPTPPPIPPAIARALEYLATKPTPEPVTEEYSYYY